PTPSNSRPISRIGPRSPTSTTPNRSPSPIVQPPPILAASTAPAAPDFQTERGVHAASSADLRSILDCDRPLALLLSRACHGHSLACCRQGTRAQLGIEFPSRP